MKLPSVHVGTPQTVEWDGRKVRTAISEHPVEGPRFLTRLKQTLFDEVSEIEGYRRSSDPLPSGPAGRSSSRRSTITWSRRFRF